MIEIVAKDGAVVRVHPEDIQGMHGLMRLRPDLVDARGLSDDNYRSARVDDGTRVAFFADTGIPTLDTAEPMSDLMQRAGLAA